MSKKKTLAYIIEVLTETTRQCSECGKSHPCIVEWKQLRSTEGKIYSYETKVEAERIKRMSYGDSTRVRITELEYFT